MQLHFLLNYQKVLKIMVGNIWIKYKNLLSAWYLKALSTGDVWFGCSLEILIIASIPFYVISILSRPRNVFSSDLGISLRDYHSGYSFSFISKNFSQNLEHSKPPCPSNTANKPTPVSKLGFVICASSYMVYK